MSDPFTDAVQPSCPRCSVVMRPTADGDECPECGHLERYADVERPEDDSPGLPGF